MDVNPRTRHAPPDGFSENIQGRVRNWEKEASNGDEDPFPDYSNVTPCHIAGSTTSRGLKIFFAMILGVVAVALLAMVLPQAWLDIRAAAEARAEERAKQEQAEYERSLLAQEQHEKEIAERQRAEDIEKFKELLEDPTLAAMIANGGAGNTEAEGIVPQAVYGTSSQSLEPFTKVKEVGVLGLLLAIDKPKPKRVTTLWLEFATAKQAEHFYANSMVEVHRIYKDVVKAGGLRDLPIGQIAEKAGGFHLEPGTYYHQGTTLPIPLQASQKSGQRVGFDLTNLPKADMYLVDVSPGKRTDYYLVKN